MHHSAAILVAVVASTLPLIQGECVEKCRVPTLVYHDLKCTPKYDPSQECCPKEYDCSHIYNRPAGTCHLRGKFYKPGERPNAEDVAGNCDHALCECSQNQEFTCVVPSDSCAEFWVPDFTKPGCYLTHELNRCCSNGQKCEPFSDVKCNVNGKIYNEQQRFEHPNQKCTFCICDKGYNGKPELPYCQIRNCTTELKYSKEINNHCAPVYRDLDSCCPQSWICPSNDGEYIPASTPPTNQDLKCKFGEKTLLIGEKYEGPGARSRKTSCECVIPPYLTCTEK